MLHQLKVHTLTIAERHLAYSEPPSDAAAAELIQKTLASIPMLETEEQKAQKRKERLQAIFKSKGKELVQNVISGVQREVESELSRSVVKKQHPFFIPALDAPNEQSKKLPSFWRFKKLKLNSFSPITGRTGIVVTRECRRATGRDDRFRSTRAHSEPRTSADLQLFGSDAHRN